MPFMPTDFAQIHDFSEGAGKTLLATLASERDPYKNLMDLADRTIGAYTKAQESENVANAVAKIREGMENGLSVNEATAGIQGRITGSKAVQDRIDAIRNSLIAQSGDKRAWEQQKVQAAQAAATIQALKASLQDTLYQREAMKWEAELAKNRAQYGTGADALFFKEHENEIKKNPYAYKFAASTIKNYDVADPNNYAPLDPKKQKELEEFNAKVFNEGISWKNNLKNKFAGIGLTQTEIDKIKQFSNYDNYVADLAKNYGYSGEDVSDLQDNFNKTRHILEAHAAENNIPQELIGIALKESEYTPFLSYLSKRAQVKFDPEKGKAYLDRIASAYLNFKNKYDVAKPDIDFFESEDNRKAYDTIRIQRSNALNIINNQERAGIISPVRANMLRAQVEADFNKQTNPYTDSLFRVMRATKNF